MQLQPAIAPIGEGVASISHQDTVAASNSYFLNEPQSKEKQS